MTPLKISIISSIASLVLLFVVLELIRSRRLRERYALLWLFSSAILLALAVWRSLLETLASKIGIFYPPSALFAVAFAFVLVMLLHFSLSTSRLSDQNKVLAQRLALLQQRVDELTAERAEQEKSATLERASTH